MIYIYISLCSMRREREVGLASACHSTHVEARDHFISFFSHRVGLPETEPRPRGQMVNASVL